MADIDKSPRPPTDEPWERVDAVVRRFEEAWRQGGTFPEIDDYLPHDGPASLCLEVLEELVHADRRWRQTKELAPASDYAERYPQLRTRMANRETELRVPAPKRDAVPADLTPPFEIGNYRIEARIDKGGMGVVYRATHAFLKKPVAFKILRPEYMVDPHAVARFRREIVAIGKLDHDNIVRATDAHIGPEGGVHYLVMDLIDGIDLSKIVRLQGRLSIADACAVVFQAANGLQYAHEHKFVHRDIKPSNLLLSVKGEVKILDLGLALLSEGKTPETALTASGQVMGTADYMAPEQWEASHSVDIRADIYSLGFTLYTLLAGQPPFAGPEYKSMPQKMAAHFRATAAQITEQRSDVPVAVANLLARMIAKKPEDRPATPAEVTLEMQSFAAGADLTGLARRAMALQRPRVAEEQLAAAGDAVTVSRPTTGGKSPTDASRTSQNRERVFRAVWITAVLGVGVITIAIGSVFMVGREKRALLDKDPEVLTFPSGGISWWAIKRNGQQPALWVHADGESLLQIGDAKEAGYEIEATLEQAEWGEAGLFFGLHDEVYKDRPCKKYQIIKIVNREGRFSIAHVCVRQFANSKTNTVGSKAVPISPPARRGHSLKIAVAKEGVWRIHWNGREAGPILDSIYPALTGADLVGAFGVYNDLSTCEYRNVQHRFITLETK